MSKNSKNLEATEIEQKNVTTYNKEQILKSEKFKDLKDVIQVVVTESETISLNEVEKRVVNFLKREVK